MIEHSFTLFIINGNDDDDDEGYTCGADDGDDVGVGRLEGSGVCLVGGGSVPEAGAAPECVLGGNISRGGTARPNTSVSTLSRVFSEGRHHTTGPGTLEDLREKLINRMLDYTLQLGSPPLFA